MFERIKITDPEGNFIYVNSSGGNLINKMLIAILEECTNATIGDVVTGYAPPDVLPGAYLRVPQEASDAMMNAGVAAARTRQPAANGAVGHRQIRAAWDAMLKKAQANG